MNFFTKAKVSPQGKVNVEDLKSWGRNALVFSSPALVVFFAQLQMGVSLKQASLLALYVFYGLLVDLFKKFNEGKK